MRTLQTWCDAGQQTRWRWYAEAGLSGVATLVTPSSFSQGWRHNSWGRGHGKDKKDLFSLRGSGTLPAVLGRILAAPHLLQATSVGAFFVPLPE